MVQIRHNRPGIFFKAPERGGIAFEHTGQACNQSLGIEPARHQGIKHGCRLSWISSFNLT
jgi:hypothetical protein